MKVEHELKLNRTEMSVIRWMDVSTCTFFIPPLDHFYQHFLVCIFDSIYSYYILPRFCHLLCNPVDIFLSCCTLQLINKLLPCLFLCKSNTSPCICLASLYLIQSLDIFVYAISYIIFFFPQ